MAAPPPHPGSRASTASAASVAVPVRLVESITLIEALDRASATAALDALLRLIGMPEAPAGFRAGVYDLAFALPACDAGRATAFRRAGWDALATTSRP
jgi:hypothetical protein